MNSYVALLLLVTFTSTILCAPSNTEKFSASDCSKPIHIGRTTCFAAFPIYTWKHDQQKCEKGLYGGCHGSKNIFQTLEECQDIAGNICKSRK
jgi:hypothetical protein